MMMRIRNIFVSAEIHQALQSHIYLLAKFSAEMNLAIIRQHSSNLGEFLLRTKTPKKTRSDLHNIEMAVTKFISLYILRINRGSEDQAFFSLALLLSSTNSKLSFDKCQPKTNIIEF
jgi:uncharacterized protein VirK/YbjX